MAIDVILGLQWGDEGKGKIVDFLADKYDVVARFQGGPNAGHTLVIDGVKHVLHTIPSGVFRPGLINLIGNGVVIDPITLVRELEALDAAGVDYTDRLLVANKAHLILPTHRWLDAASEAAKGKEKVGSTLRGIGPTYMDKTGRNGLRTADILQPGFKNKYEALKAKHASLLTLYPSVPFNIEEEEAKWMEAIQKLAKLRFVEGSYFVNEQLKAGKRVLAEGAQGSMLDIDFGTYPFVTSSNTVTAGVCIGLGVAPQTISEVIGIVKAYCTRVGTGPFPSELFDEAGDQLRKKGHEFGSTTGRPRRCGWIDLPQLQYSIMINGVTQLAITKLDILNSFSEIKAATSYSFDGQTGSQIPYDLQTIPVELTYDSFPGWERELHTESGYESLPKNAKEYLAFLEGALNVPITMVSTGPGRNELIIK